MTEIITYSLRDDQKRSDQYYEDVSAFTDKVLVEAESRTRMLVEAFQTHLRQPGRETPRTFPEYALELLTLGVLWRIYIGAALDLSRLPQRVLAYLVRLRQRRGLLKPGADFLRGVLGGLFVSTNGHYPTAFPELTLDHLDRLLDWLSATDTFKQEVKRLRLWRDFLAEQPPNQISKSLEIVIAFAAWFEEHSETTLGRYTPNVERFLNETHPGYRWRENALFCGRQRVEYHMNMVGTEILNRAFREKFLESEQKIVLLPPCMKAKPQNQCEARQTPLGQRCAGCTPNCRVHQVTKLGEKQGFNVLIMPHELSVFSNSKMKPTMDSTVGIVGVSCPLTNVTGGWETKAMGVPAQGVLLDYCGCPWHWHPEGIPTDINFNQLLQVLDLKQIRER